MRKAIAFCLLAAALSQAEDQHSRMDEIIESYVSDNRFMGSVLVAKGGKILLSKGYGSAELEWSVPNTPDTKFRLGSVTKQFTAASILLLQERGKLQVHHPVKK
jgi:CubicO group peptidase (beta-lactamase class C family)